MNLEFDFVKVCRYLAVIILFLGTIGSVMLASNLGLSYDTSGYYLIEERNWGTTIGVFGGGVLGSAFMSSILWFFAEVLTKLSRILTNILNKGEK